MNHKLTNFFKPANADGQLPEGYTRPELLPIAAEVVEEVPEPIIAHVAVEKRPNNSKLFTTPFRREVVEHCKLHGRKSTLRTFPQVCKPLFQFAHYLIR